MAEKIQIYQIVKGSLMETEDWWYLVTEDDGSKYVEHEWSHVGPYRLGSNSNSGTKRIEIAEFLASDAPEPAKSALTERLG